MIPFILLLNFQPNVSNNAKTENFVCFYDSFYPFIKFSVRCFQFHKKLKILFAFMIPFILLLNFQSNVSGIAKSRKFFLLPFIWYFNHFYAKSQAKIAFLFAIYAFFINYMQTKHPFMQKGCHFCILRSDYSSAVKLSLPTPQSSQAKSAGRSSHFTPFSSSS